MDDAPQPTPSLEVVREWLLGMTRPDADSDAGLAAVDVVAGWVAGRDIDALVALAVVLVELSTDTDVVVAGRASSVLSVFVERCTSVGVARADLVVALAERLPALVTAYARSWVRPHDAAAIARLGQHHRRVAVATAVRPWHPDAIREVETTARQQGWHGAELDAVMRVMRDDAPELTAPSGVGDVDLSGRWWIVAERSWDWTLWRSVDGRHVLERVEGGVGMWTSVHDLSDETAAAIVTAAIAGVELPGQRIAVSPPPEPRP